MKKIAVFLLLALILTLPACAKKPAGTTGPAATSPGGSVYTGPTNPTALFQYDYQISTLTVTAPNPETGAQEEIFRTQDAEESSSVVALFDDWSLTDNKVPAEQILDLACPVVVTFDNGTVICLPLSVPNSSCYGTLNGVPYYLPLAFCQYIEELLTQK